MTNLRIPDPAGQIWNTRAAVLVSAILVFISTVCVLAPHSALLVFDVILTDGALAFGWILGAMAGGAFVLHRFKIRANPFLFLATAGGLGLGIFSLIALGLGLLGWLNQATALVLPIVCIVLFAIDRQTRKPGKEIDREAAKRALLQRADLPWLWLIPTVSLAFAAVAASVMPGVLWKPLDPHPYDVLSYHLQVPREWYETGQILPLSHNVFSYFPFNVEMQFLLLMHVARGPWNAMYICQFLNVGYSVLAILGIAGAISEKGKPVIGAAIASVIPWIIMLAGVAYVESALVLYTTLAMAWVMRNDLSEIALAGAMAGFACGVKITAIPMLLVAVPVALFVTSLILRNQKSTVRNCIIFLFAGGVVLSPWLIRNIVWAGNPIFPIAMKTLGHAHFFADQIERFRIAHSPTAAQRSAAARIQILWTDVLTHWQFGYILLPAGLAAIGLRLRDRQMLILLFTGAISFFVWIAFTHLLARFLVILVPLAAIAIGEFSWKRTLPLAVILVVAAAVFGWSSVYSPLTSVTRDPLQSNLIARQNLDFLIPPELSDMNNSTKEVGLVGDAGAFLYQMPMTRLHYRTVFDLPPDITDPIAAWVDPKAKDDPNWLLVINPAEIERLHKTYLNIPPLPPEWNHPDQMPFVLHGK